MEIQIGSKKENKLLGRMEVEFSVSHSNERTPRREVLRSELATLLHVSKDVVIIDHIYAEFGKQQCVGYAKIYSSVENAKKIERKHSLKRNRLIGDEKEKEKE